jgi:anti-sigma-K factor RskA
MMTHDAMREAIAAYALDALDPAERAEAEREMLAHLPGCDECLVLMRDLREVSGDLAFAPGPEAVDPALEARILTEIRSTTAAPPASPKRPFVLRAVGVAAALALVASLGWNAALIDRNQRSADQVAALSVATRLAADPTTRSVALRGANDGMVLLYRPGGKAVLVASGIAAPPEGKVLELWLIADGKPTPVVTFRPDAGIVVVPIDHDPARFAGAAITVEDGFAPAPTTEPIYAGTIRA